MRVVSKQSNRNCIAVVSSDATVTVAAAAAVSIDISAVAETELELLLSQTKLLSYIRGCKGDSLLLLKWYKTDTNT